MQNNISDACYLQKTEVQFFIVEDKKKHFQYKILLHILSLEEVSIDVSRVYAKIGQPIKR